ncbi:hypothetical protein J3E64_002945 [Sphingobium sp. OAS761]|uniref:class I SAM-dependent methyltransferase n=1 Tax=Sphingobium sp. OAS761 TaxID=2817901 RepID=UPI00209E1FF4|nr:class I SAM-dependent methyltransferase [Sphingobium sp. OAS761]MCP1471241.1 hypothetical protein [Sphingobium sp. OAS761]
MLQGDRPWGAFLDAGTGTNSIRWVSGLATERWVAVTGATGDAVQERDASDRVRRAQDRIIVGNWADPTLLAGESFDTILADYLIGAVEGFAPYFQERLFARLRTLTRGRLYLVGLEPYVAERVETADGQILCDIGRWRDAVLLHAGERPYREFPMEWVLEQMTASGFRVVSAHRFPIRYQQRFVNSQIDMCASRLSRLEDRALAAALHARGEALRQGALAFIAREGGLRHGFDYVIAAETG